MLSGLLLALALGAQTVLSTGHSAWKLNGMQSLVTFGDSYTDESRLVYFIEHQEAPPVGWRAPEVTDFLFLSFLSFFSPSCNFPVFGRASYEVQPLSVQLISHFFGLNY